MKVLTLDLFKFYTFWKKGGNKVFSGFRFAPNNRSLGKPDNTFFFMLNTDYFN